MERPKEDERTLALMGLELKSAASSQISCPDPPALPLLRAPP